MKSAAKLRVIEREPTTEDELRALLRARQRIERERVQNDAALQPLRRRYADARGEMMLPTIERLRRELLG